MGIRERSGDVFVYLENRYRKVVILKIMEWGGTSTDGEDIYGESILILMEMVNKRGFKLTCKLSSLLLQICKFQWTKVLEKNVAKRNYRRRNNESWITEDSSEEMDLVLKQKIYKECFTKLGNECRHILTAYFKEIPPREIADIFGVSYVNLRRKKSLCHGALMRILDHHSEYRFLKTHEDLKLEPITSRHEQA
jgi:RNA polymerase sigma factor (sigma-70 family)